MPRTVEIRRGAASFLRADHPEYVQTEGEESETSTDGRIEGESESRSFQPGRNDDVTRGFG